MPRKTKNYAWKRASKVKCARGSIRTIKMGKSKVGHVCCPWGKWRGGKCAVGTKLLEIGSPR